MRILLIYICIVFCGSVASQTQVDTIQFIKYSHFISPEILIGTLSEPNTDFPEVGIQKSFYLSFGAFHNSNNQEWAYRLNHPKTGLSFGFSDYGNAEKVGRSYSILPFTDFGLFESNRLRLMFGLGMSYHNVQYNIKTNPTNKGISTEFAWAFRGALLYELWRMESSTLKLGINYLHHSNGHVKLPNQGFNSFLIGLAYEMNYNQNYGVIRKIESFAPHKRSTYNFLDVRFGLGQNVLSQIFNDKKAVYTTAFSYGKVINNTYKLSVGAHYRFYEHYYDYIKNEEDLVLERYPQFSENPFGYASNIGIHGSGELLLNHFGAEFQLGLNIYKPAYQVDWILNQGYVFIAYDADNEPYVSVVYGELDWYYEIKRTVSSRLGLKYYLFGTDKQPVHNFYVGAHINANLGQADFNELSFGYVYSFNFKGKN